MQIRNDDVLNVFVSVFDWTTRINQLHAPGFGERNLEIRVAHARVKVSMFDVEPVAGKLAGCFVARPAGGAAGRFFDRQIEQQRQVGF